MTGPIEHNFPTGHLEPDVADDVDVDPSDYWDMTGEPRHGERFTVEQLAELLP